MVAGLGNLGLAVGFAWNYVASWVPRKLMSMKEVEAPIFVFIIQFLYYVVITVAIVCIDTRWSKAEDRVKKRDEEKRRWSESGHTPGQSDPVANAENSGASSPPATRKATHEARVMQEMLRDIVDDAHEALRRRSEQGEGNAQAPSESSASTASSADLDEKPADGVFHELEDASRNVVLSALHFVYAWAQLDTANALVFTYLLGCESAGACGYRNNFLFAVAATIFFARVCVVLKLEKRYSDWNKASVALTTRACSLNTGWAWAGYCKAAIASAQGFEVFSPILMCVICMLFAWVCISFIHRRFEVERRAWDRHCKEEAEELELDLQLSAP